MKTSIFIRSYHRDFPWLAYCLRSIHKFCSGFHEVVVAIPEGEHIELTEERVVHVPDFQPGYVGQQVTKIYADTFVADADAVMFVDSDCVFHSPTTPESVMTGEMPNWLYTPMEKTSEDARKAWIPVMRDCIGQEPPHEFMRRHPQMIPCDLLGAFREFVQEKHGKPVEDYALGRPHRSFSEFNVMGFYFWLNYPDRFNWINTEDYLPPGLLTQHWSHGGLTDQIRQEIEGILA